MIGKDRERSERIECQILPRALWYVRKGNRDWAIDGGANVGRWSRVMAQHFRCVMAFEPGLEAFTQLKAEAPDNVIPYQVALMDRLCHVTMQQPKNRSVSTAAFAERSDEGLPAVTIDSLDLKRCGLIKLDLEGAEMQALLGAVRTLKRCQPVLVVECIDKQLKRYGNSTRDIRRWLGKRGYVAVDYQYPNRVYIPVSQQERPA